MKFYQGTHTGETFKMCFSGSSRKRKKLIATLLAMLLVTALAETLFLRVGIANPLIPHLPGLPRLYVSPPNPAIIKILEPRNKTSYNGNSVTLRVSVTDLSEIYSLSCLLDEREISIPQTGSFRVNLTDLPEGTHTIKITVSNQRMQTYDFCYYDNSGSIVPAPDRVYSVVVRSDSEVSFTVDNTSPQVSVLSPQGGTYGSEIVLDFKADEPTSQVTYSLDGQENVTAVERMKLIGLSSGAHSITVYAWDNAGNVGASETITFTVATFPTSQLVTASIIASAAVSFGLVAYFLRRKKKRGEA
jgi:hypothetical protein